MKLLQITMLMILIGSNPSLAKDGSEYKVIIGADLWCPYACSSSDPEYEGFSIELVRKALKIEGWELEYHNASFQRVDVNVFNGTWHILPATNSLATPSLKMTEEPVGYLRFVFIVNKDSSWTYKNVDSLHLVTLGVIGGYSYSPEIDQYIEQYKDTEKVSLLFAENASVQNLKMLMKGRIDVYIEDETVTKHRAKQMGILEQIKVVGVAFESPLYCGLKPDSSSSSLKVSIDRGIQKMKSNGELNQLLKKYEIQYWE
jgi:polar amino acid transport system substrate-binding protein